MIWSKRYKTGSKETEKRSQDRKLKKGLELGEYYISQKRSNMFLAEPEQKFFSVMIKLTKICLGSTQNMLFNLGVI